MASIEYQKFFFIPPPYPSETDYTILKVKLSNNENLKINPPSDGFFKTFRGMVLLFILTAVAISLSYLEIAEWLDYVAGFMAFLTFMAYLSFMYSFSYYCDYRYKKWRYYRKVKNGLLKSKNYKDFIRIMEEKTWLQKIQSTNNPPR